MTNQYIKKIRLGLLLVFAMIGSYAVGAYAFQKGGIMHVTSVGQPRLLNPVFDRRNQARDIYNHIFSGLVSVNEQGELVPDLAAYVPTVVNGGVQVQDDGSMIVQYTLRPNVYWHDGQPFTAEDVRFTWQMHTDPRIKFPPTPGYQFVKRVEVLDLLTVRVYIQQLDRDYNSLFRYILPRHAFRSRHWLFNEKHPFNFHPIGTGPYVFKEWKDNQLILDANPNYYLGKAYLDQMRYQFKPLDLRLIPTSAEWVNPSHLISHLSILSYEYLKARKDIDIRILPSYEIEHLDLNMAHPILADIRVRRAIAYAIDRSEISRIFFGLAEPAYGTESRQSWKYNPIVDNYYKYNPSKSEKLLEEAGWVFQDDDYRSNLEGDSLSLILVAVKGNKSHLLVSEYLKKALATIGIELQVNFVTERQLFEETLPRGQYEIALYPWDSSPGHDSYNLWHSSQIPPRGHNYTRFSDYQVDRVLNDIQHSVEFAVLEKNHWRLAELIADAVPAIPLYYNPNLEVSKKIVHNFRPNIHDGSTWNSYEWWIE